MGSTTEISFVHKGFSYSFSSLVEAHGYIVLNINPNLKYSALQQRWRDRRHKHYTTGQILGIESLNPQERTWLKAFKLTRKA